MSMKRAFHSLGGLFVRSATALGRDVLRLELCPSDNEARDFLKHLHRLGDSDSFVVEVPMDLLESMTSPEEFGSREHKIAMLQGNCINLKVSILERPPGYRGAGCFPRPFLHHGGERKDGVPSHATV